MFKKNVFRILLAAAVLTASGCATTSRNTQSDIDSLNAKIAALQGQLSEKDSEISKLQNQMRDESAARAQAENERKMLSDRLDAATAKLQAKPAAPKVSDSDLK